MKPAATSLQRPSLVWLLLFFLAAQSYAAEKTKLTLAYSTTGPTAVGLWMAKEIGAFDKYGADPNLIFISSSPVMPLAVKLHRTGALLLQSRDDVQESRLAATGGSDDPKKFVVTHFEVDAAQGAHRSLRCNKFFGYTVNDDFHFTDHGSFGARNTKYA